MVTAYAERLRLWPPQQRRFSETIRLPGWPMEQGPQPGQRLSLYDLQARRATAIGWSRALPRQGQPGRPTITINTSRSFAG